MVKLWIWSPEGVTGSEETVIFPVPETGVPLAPDVVTVKLTSAVGVPEIVIVFAVVFLTKLILFLE